MPTTNILWLVKRGNAHVVTYKNTPESAKRAAATWLGGNPDEYTVTPLTQDGDRIHLDITVNA